jgi:energy-converting hydrogenase Eha subunit A
MYGTPLLINDLAVLKTVPITERVKFSFQVEAINAFNHPVLAVGVTNIDSTSFGQTGPGLNLATNGIVVGPRNLQIRARLDW